MNALRLISLGLAFASALAVSPAPAAAGDDDDANGFYVRGKRAYAGGHYAEAVNEYQRGYALTREARFLLGMARAYETLGDLPRAREYYRRFEAEAPKDDPDRGTAAAALAKLDPVGHVPPPKPYLDGGRTAEEIRAALGDNQYDRYVASGLTLSGFQQRDAGNKLATEGIVVVASSLAVGVGMILSAGKANSGRALIGYCVAVVGTPIGFAMIRAGFHTSTMANYQIRPSSAGTTVISDGGPRAAFGSLAFAF